MPYTMPSPSPTSFTPIRSSEPTGRTNLLLLLVDQLNLDNSEISDIITQLSRIRHMREEPIIADEYDLSAQPDYDSDDDSGYDMPALMLDRLEEDEDDEEEDEEEDEGDDESGPDPETLVIVGGEPKFVKDITSRDLGEVMSDAEYTVYMSLYPESESASESEWLNED